MAKWGWEGKAGENNLKKKVRADKDKFHNYNSFSWPDISLVNAMEPEC